MRTAFTHLYIRYKDTIQTTCSAYPDTQTSSFRSLSRRRGPHPSPPSIKKPRRMGEAPSYESHVHESRGSRIDIARAHIIRQSIEQRGDRTGFEHGTDAGGQQWRGRQYGHVRQTLLFRNRHGVRKHDFPGTAIAQAFQAGPESRPCVATKVTDFAPASCRVRTASQMVPAVSMMSSTTTHSRPSTSPMMPCATA